MKRILLQTIGFIVIIVTTINVKAQNIYTFAGTQSTPGYAGDGGLANLAQLAAPRGIIVGRTGNIYFCDSRNNVVRMVSASGIITTVAGDGTNAYGGDGGPATAAQLSNPAGIAFDNIGNMYITDSRNNAIRMVDGTGTITTIAGGGFPGYSGDGGPAAAAQINRPTGIAISNNGLIYFSDSRNNVVRLIDTLGNINTVVGNGTAGFGGDSIAATSTMLNRPQGLAISNTGILYIADNGNFRVRMVDTGMVYTYAGNGTAGNSGDGGLAILAMISGPTGLALDTLGNLLVADAANNIRKVTSTHYISTIAGTGTAGYFGDGGAAVHAQINTPSAVAINRTNGDIYISDAGNNVVRRIGTSVVGISITTTTGDTVCTGRGPIAFFATPIADSMPAHYQWQLNTVNVGRDTSMYIDSTIVAGDVINCELLDTTGTVIAMSSFLVANSIPVVGLLTYPATICVGSAIRFRDTSFGGRWVITDTFIANMIPFPPGNIKGLTVGLDTAYYIKSNVCGADTAKAYFSVVNNLVGAISGQHSICEGSSAIYSDTTAGGHWRTRPPFAGTMDTLTGTFTANVNPGPGGFVIITYGISPSCYVTDTVTIDSLPLVMPIAGALTVDSAATTTLTDGTPSGIWSSSDVTIATVDSLSGVVTGLKSGTVTITYTVTNAFGCANVSTYTITVLNPAGIRNMESNYSFNVYPNPASNQVVLQWNGNVNTQTKVIITDITGREVYSSTLAINKVKGQISIDISGFNKGIYILSVKGDALSYCNKLIVE